MKISTNSIAGMNRRYHTAGDPAPDGVPALVTRIGAQLGEVETTINFGARFAGVLVVKVIACDDHPNADRLHVCKIDDGGKAIGVDRDESGYVQVVCGAPNVRAGITVAWLPPGSTVPESLASDPFVLEARALRGVISNGMLASPRELTLSDSHEGIFEIADDIAPGTSFVSAFNLQDDVVIDIENKMFTHRPDCFGFMGVARELEGIAGRAYVSPDWYQMNPGIPAIEADELRLEVHNHLMEDVRRYTAITMRDVMVKPSPSWLVVELAKYGMRSINNIVDYTNFFMLETGQPLHAYDYDKVMAQDAGADHARIVIRNPKPDETILLLNGKTIVPRPEAIMIATHDRAIGIGGVMGGGDTEVSDTSTNIIIESASFNMYSIRRTSMTHGLFTDAVTRFNKGQSPLQTKTVLAKIVDEIRVHAGGKVASPLIDDIHVPAAAMERASLYPPITLSPTFINDRLGLSLSGDDMKTLLRNVEFDVSDAPKPTRVILMHGKDKSPADIWYPWLKQACEAEGLRCDIPELPNSAAPVLDEWLRVLTDLNPDEHTVLVGHSRGGMAILRWLEQAAPEVHVGKVVLLAANHPELPDLPPDSFYMKPDYDYGVIRQHADSFAVIHSRDDAWVPFAAGEKNAAGLGVKLVALEGLGHLTHVVAQLPLIVHEIIGAYDFVVKAPFWRTDIEIPEDIVEEVGRLYGFDQLPIELPTRSITPAAREPMFDLKQRIRQLLARNGANEVLTYSFVHGQLLDAVGHDRQQAYKLSNALSPDLQYYRMSLTPSLLDKVATNSRAGYSEFALFEMGLTHIASEIGEDGLPVEYSRLALVVAAGSKSDLLTSGDAFYEAKHYALSLLSDLGLTDDVQFLPLEPDSYLGATKHKIPYYQTGRTATIVMGDTVIGEVGEYTAATRKALKLPDFCAGFELDLGVLLMSAKPGPIYRPLPRFPKITQDITLRVASTVSYDDLLGVINRCLQAAKPPRTDAITSVLDIYQKADDPLTVHYTFRITLANHQKTLREAEASNLLDAVAAAAASHHNAERL